MVSVIVPVYQVSDYVERCIRSVMAQTYPDIECIIVDDATKDNSIEKCEQLIGAYDGSIQFRIIRHEQNRGLSAARNTGFDAANGEYVYFLDSDDYITPNCIEKLASVVNDDPAIEMVQGNSLMVCEGKDTLLYRIDTPTRISNNDEARKAFFKDRHVYISVWNRLLKKSFVEQNGLYCREGLVFEDLLWVFYLMKHLRKAYLCEETTHYYCLRQGSILVDAKPESVRCYVASFNEILNHLSEGYERDEIEGYLYYFVKRYVSYVKMVPEFKETIRLYRAKAGKYHCWYVYFVLSIVSIVVRWSSPLSFMRWLNGMRWKLKKTPVSQNINKRLYGK